MYYFFLGTMLLPIPPAKLKISSGSKNEVYTLIDEGEVSRLKGAPLEEISFEFILPSQQYPFAQYKSIFLSPQLYIDELKNLKTNKKPFQFIVTRQLPNGRILYITNTKVSLENLDFSESVEDGFDTIVSISLREYREPQTLISKIVKTAAAVVGTVQALRETTSSPAPKSEIKKHTVKKGETLWAIAKKYYGDGSKYSKIAKENNLIDPNKLTIGQILVIPKV